jgi:hypothetical protein
LRDIEQEEATNAQLYYDMTPSIMCAVNDYGFSSDATNEESYRKIRMLFTNQRSPIACAQRKKWPIFLSKPFDSKLKITRGLSRQNKDKYLSNQAADVYSFLYCCLRRLDTEAEKQYIQNGDKLF